MKYSTIITKTICLSVPFFALSCEDPQEEFSYIPPEVIYSQPGNVEDYNTPGDNAGDNDDDDVELQLPVPGPAETYPNSTKQYQPIIVEYAEKPDKAFIEAKTRILPYLVGYEQQTKTQDEYLQSVNKYGSYAKGQKFKATGRFRVEKNSNGRSWIVDPEGYPYYVRDIASFRMDGNSSAFGKLYSSVDDWVAKSQKQFSEIGFHSVCAFGKEEGDKAVNDYNKSASSPLTQAPSFSFLAEFKNSKGISYPGQNVNLKIGLVFYDGWDEWCKEYLNSDAFGMFRNNPDVLGFFSDNEIDFSTWGNRLLDRFLKISNKQDPAYIAAAKFMTDKDKSANVSDVTDELNNEFAGICAEKYYSAIKNAVKASKDPELLYLGSRLHSLPKYNSYIIKAAGKYCDVISINYYSKWSPEKGYMDGWKNQAGGTPFMVTEFYTKGEDTKLDNSSGAGFVVRDQQNRGFAYQHFTLGLLEAKNCVGWVFFKYLDDEDCNKGMLDYNYKPYTSLTKYMSDINWNVYNLIDYFDK